MSWKRLSALATFAVLSQSAFAQCPAGYGIGPGGICRANLYPEFFYGALDSSIPADRYPICGAGRVPVSGDGTYAWSTMSSSGVPRSSNSFSSGGQQYNYLRTTGGPIYAYTDLSRCVCVGKTIPETPQTGTYTFLGPLANTQRVLPDTFEVISYQSATNQIQYGMVAIADDNQSDGRLGALYSSNRSRCGCPNFNELPQAVDTALPATDPIGVRCVPAVAAGPGRVLGAFNVSVHDKPGATQVMNRANEPLLQGGVNTLVSKISLPRSVADQNTLTTYSRRIWTCTQPYRLNLATGACEYKPEFNRCDEGNTVSGVPASEVSPYMPGTSKADAFENTVNKKLAACLNEFGTISSSVKFDCIDNSSTNYATFNDLWESADPDADGGQPNGFMLTNPAGRPLTGFFKLTGERCDEYSEFVGEIKPGRLFKSGAVWDFVEQGSVIPRPASGLKGVDFLVNKLMSKGKRVPLTPLEKLQCPVLVRAALVATCPKNPALPAAQRTLEIRDGLGNLLQRRCSVANAVTVHVRAEQVFAIEGAAPMKTYDTVAENSQAGSIPVSVLTASKYGSACPPGTVRQEGVCVY